MCVGLSLCVGQHQYVMYVWAGGVRGRRRVVAARERQWTTATHSGVLAGTCMHAYVCVGGRLSCDGVASDVHACTWRGRGSREHVHLCAYTWGAKQPRARPAWTWALGSEARALGRTPSVLPRADSCQYQPVATTLPVLYSWPWGEITRHAIKLCDARLPVRCLRGRRGPAL